MQLSDYAQALGAAQQLVPDYNQLRMNALTMQGEQQRQALQAQEGAREQAKFGLEQQEQQRFLSDIGTLGGDPTPEAFWKVAARHPQLRGLTQAAAALDESTRRQVVGHALQIHNALKNGKPDLAKALVQRSIDADKNSGGEPDPDDVALLGMINSGDPEQMKAALGSTYAIVAAANPDTAAKNLNDSEVDEQDFTLSAGGRRYSVDGKLIAAAPFAPQYRSVGEGETLVEVGGEGGGQASGGAGAVGGSSQPRSVRNNNPGNIVDSPFARSQPGYKGSDGRFAIFDSPQAGSGAQAALLGSYIDRGFNTVEKIIGRWAPPSENDTGAYVRSVAKALNVSPGDTLTKASIPALQTIIARVEGGPGGSSAGVPGAAASGGARVVAVGAPKQNKGPSAPSGYRYQADGVTLEPIPGGPADKGRSGGGKALPDSIVKRLEPKIEARDQLTSALGNFKDDYAGHTILGDASNSLQSLTGLGATGQRDWWAQFRSTDNVIRNQLFGASLTDGEKQAYNATTITPRMAPSEIRRNLRSRLQIVNKAIARQRNVLTKNGFSQDAVGALFDPLGQQQPAASSGFRILRVRPK